MEEMGYWVTDFLPNLAKNLHILLVDHDPVSLMHLTSLLEQQFYNVTTTQLASVALSMIQEKGDRFDLVMANVSMLDMDIFSFLHELLKKNIAVILMLSSGTNLNAATKPLAEGACYFLPKPISKDDLKYVWQRMHRRNKNVTKQPHQLNCMEKSKYEKESIGMKITDTVDLSRPNVAVSYNNNSYINNQPMKYKGKERKNKIEYHDSLVGPNFGIKRSSNETKGIKRDKRVKYYLDSSKFGRSCVVWNAERHRKFMDALNMLGDQSRPKLILKLMNEPCLTLRQVANHLQKYKAHVEYIQRRTENKFSSKKEASISNFSARTQLYPLLQKQPHKMSRTSVLGGAKFRPIAPKTQPIPRLPISDFVNCGLKMVNHNFHHVGLNYTEVEGVQKCELNFPNISKTTSNAAACSRAVFDEIQFSDLSAFGVLETQEAVQKCSGATKEIQSTFGYEGSHPFAQYADLLNVLEDDPYNFSSDLNLSDVDKYCEWLRNTVLENGGGPNSGNAP